MDIQERQQLLSNFDVVVPAAPAMIMGSSVSASEPIKGTDECGLIVGSAMHGCIDGLGVANKYAVVNSQLLVERAASAKFDNETQPTQWFKRHLEAEVPGRFWERTVEQTDIRFAASECMLAYV